MRLCRRHLLLLFVLDLGFQLLDHLHLVFLVDVDFAAFHAHHLLGELQLLGEELNLLVEVLIALLITDFLPQAGQRVLCARVG